MEKLKIKNEKFIKLLKEMNFEIVRIDENITNVFKSFNNKYLISIYFHNLIKGRENEFSDFEYNKFYLYDENNNEIISSKNINDLFYEIMEI